MKRRLTWAVRLVALLGIAGTLSGCAVYPATGYAYRSPGYYGGGPVLRPYYRPYRGYGGGWYGRGYGGYYGRPY